jgi:hypothetical protein
VGLTIKGSEELAQCYAVLAPHTEEAACEMFRQQCGKAPANH